MTADQLLPLMILAVLVLVVFALARSAVQVVPATQRLVIHRLGRVQPQPRGPGMALVIPLLERAQVVELRERDLPLPPVTLLTQDQQSMKVVGKATYRIVDPIASVNGAENAMRATSNLYVTTLRALLMATSLAVVVPEALQIQALQQMNVAAKTWGVEILKLELQLEQVYS